MASSNAPSGSKSSQPPDLGLSNPSVPPLRKPHSATTTSKSSLDTVISATQSLNISSDSSNTQASTLQPKSILSPNAKEFVPRSYQPQVVQQQHHHQHQQQHHQPSTGGGRPHHNQKSYNDGTNGTSRKDNWQVAEANSYPPNNDNDSEFDDYYALAYLTDFINQVSAMPHMYDEEILNLTEVLNSCIDEDEEIVLQCIVNNIVDQAIIDPNFRYSGVRLCEHLIHNLTVSAGSRKGSFKQELVNRCQREHSRRRSMMTAQDKGLYLRGFTLFVADLSTKLTNEEVLLNALPDLMETLLSEPSADNVKTVVLAMKLCGQSLESSRKGQFEKIVSLLKEVANGAESSISSAVTNLMELIARSWQPPPQPAGLSRHNPYASGATEDPLPEEYERTYHEDATYYNGYNGGDYGYSNYSGTPSYDFGNGDEADSDVVDAYEEFLRASGQLK